MTGRAATIFDDREVLDLLQDRPDLLAIADAVRATQAARRRHVPLVRVGLLAAAIAVAAVVALVAPWQGGGGFTARALAALGDGQVIHVVSMTSLQATVIDLATGSEQPLTQRSEVWFDAARGLERTVSTIDGRLVQDQLWRGNGGHGPELDPALGGFVSGYRAALADGRATRDGSGTVDGRPVEWLRFAKGAVEPPGSSQPSAGTAPFVERVALDAQTLKPVLLEGVVGGKVVGRTRITSIETLHPAQVDFTPSKPPSPQSESSTVLDEHGVPPSAAASALGGHLLWLGESSGGLAFEQAVLQRISDSYGPGKPTTVSSGVRIVYHGSAGDVVLQESQHAEGLYGFLGEIRQAPPKGRMLVTGSVPGPPGSWTGLLTEDGLYISIQAPTKALLLVAARALTPIG